MYKQLRLIKAHRNHLCVIFKGIDILVRYDDNARISLMTIGIQDR